MKRSERIQDLQREIDRLQEAKRRALAVADERAKEAAELRLENERLRAQLVSVAKGISRPEPLAFGAPNHEPSTLTIGSGLVWQNGRRKLGPCYTSFRSGFCMAKTRVAHGHNRYRKQTIRLSDHDHRFIASSDVGGVIRLTVC
jgi:hypothetical protein